MINGDYFFLIFLGVIAVIRILLVKERYAPTIKGFRLRHYMYGLVLMILAFLTNNLTIYAVGLALFLDELPLILIKGLGYKQEHWGYPEYHSSWCVAGVLILIFLTYFFRDVISGLI